MKIYTSYFANMKNLPENLIPISIAGKTPNGINCIKYSKLMPKYDWWKFWKDNGMEQSYYIEKYNETVLNKLIPQKCYQELKELTNNKDCVLLCYEKDKFCHRYLVSKWFKEAGIEINEYAE